MRFLKRIAGYLGLARDENDDQDRPIDDHTHEVGSLPAAAPRPRAHVVDTGLPRKGFSVPVQVAVERSHPGPVLAPSHSGDGGLQGLQWYAKRLKVDEDGDVADEFFDEVAAAPETLTSTPAGTENERKPLVRFQLKYNARPARVERQAISQDGRLQQRVEHRGRLQWV